MRWLASWNVLAGENALSSASTPIETLRVTWARPSRSDFAHRLLHHVDVELADAGHEGNRVLGQVRHVGIDHEPDLVADGLTDLAHARDVLGDVARDFQLQCAIAFIDQRLGVLGHAGGILEREHAADRDCD